MGKVKFLESIIEKFLFTADNEHYMRYSVVRVLERLYPYEIEQIRNMRCPWCGRKMKSHTYMRKHLLHSSSRCALEYNAMVKDTIETYVEMLRKISKAGCRKEMYRVEAGNKVKYFKTMKDATTYYLENMVV